jgi:hypothetical protein
MQMYFTACYLLDRLGRTQYVLGKFCSEAARTFERQAERKVP